MKTVKKNVYYCDHCKKRSLSASATTKHENHCTANPKRLCRMCEGNDIESIVEDFKKRFVLNEYLLEDHLGNLMGTDLKVQWISEPVTIKELRDSVNDCPACLLAVIRQCKFQYHYFEGLTETFDFKKELRAAMDVRNNLQ